MESRMKEPHRKGVANRPDPESCAGGREVAGEALTGAHTGQPSSSEITSIGVPTLCYEGEGYRPDGDSREPLGHAAESKTLSMCGNSMRENRETPGAPLPATARDGRRRRFCRTSGVHVPGESDDLVVPTRRANKAGPWAAAEPAEGRGSREGTVLAADHAPDSEPELAGRLGGEATLRALLWRGCVIPERGAV
jgi:hypothetical protein